MFQTEKSLHISEYNASVQEIKALSQQVGLKDDEFSDIFDQCFNDSFTRLRKPKQPKLFRFSVLTVSIILLLLLFNWKGVCSFILCNIQECIYPGLKMLRKASIPIVKMFPSLTDLYDESCLIQNPYFQVVDMDCWPCSAFKNVIEIQDHGNSLVNPVGEPYIYKTNQKTVTPAQLQNMYRKKSAVFDQDASKILFNNQKMLSARSVLNNISEMDITNKSFIWRMNRIGPAQAIRKLFPRPAILPQLGLSTERFIIVEGGGSAKWKIPDPECNNVFLLQAHGDRLIELNPVKECRDQCKPVTFTLRESHLLIYNWWYWRPTSFNTDKNNDSSIIFMGSYC